MSQRTARIEVAYQGGDRLAIAVRGHQVVADQPVDEGGEDAGPTPTELFVGSLAGCVAFYAERFLRRRGLGTNGLVVGCEWEWAHEPARVGAIAITVDAPSLTPELRDAFTRVVERCPIHSTLQRSPDVTFAIRSPALAAAI